MKKHGPLEYRSEDITSKEAQRKRLKVFQSIKAAEKSIERMRV